jgi:hypothetical protein
VLLNDFLIASLIHIPAVCGSFFLAREDILFANKIIFPGIEPDMLGTATTHCGKKSKHEKITQMGTTRLYVKQWATKYGCGVDVCRRV